MWSFVDRNNCIFCFDLKGCGLKIIKINVAGWSSLLFIWDQLYPPTRTSVSKTTSKALKQCQGFGHKGYLHQDLSYSHIIATLQSFVLWSTHDNFLLSVCQKIGNVVMEWETWPENLSLEVQRPGNCTLLSETLVLTKQKQKRNPEAQI